jgi:hypothetical protein
MTNREEWIEQRARTRALLERIRDRADDETTEEMRGLLSDIDRYAANAEARRPLFSAGSCALAQPLNQEET